MPDDSKDLIQFDDGGAADDKTASRLSKAIFFLLCAIPIFSVVAFGAVDVWALGLLSACAGSIGVLWLLDAWRRKKFYFDTSVLQFPLAGLILIGLTQLLPLRRADFAGELLSIPAAASLSLAPYSTRLALVQLMVYFVFFAAAFVFINSYNRLRKIVSAMIIFSSLMAFFGILQQLSGAEAIYGLRSPGQAFSFASFVNRHHFAAFMEMTIGLTLGLLFGKATKENKRIFLLIAVLVMGMALLFTSSRGGMISLVAVVAFVVAVTALQKPARESDSAAVEVKPRSSFALVASGLALVAVLFAAVLLLGGDESLVRGMNLLSSDDISNGRTHFWQVGLQIFLHNPIFGAGLDSFGVAFSRYDTWNGMLRVEQAHNDYLQILADAGVLGLACVAAFICLLFRQSFSVIRKTESSFRRGAAIGALAGCVGVLIHSFFDFPLRTPSNALYFLTLAVLATAPISQPKSSSRRKRLKKKIQ